MATVTIQRRKKQDGTMSYPVYFVDPHTGKKKYHATYRTLKDANLATHTLREVIDKGTAPEVRRKARGLTLGEIGELCKATWLEKVASGELRQSTLKGYLDHLKGLLGFERVQVMPDGAKLTHPPLDNLKIALLTPDLIQSIRSNMAAQISAVTSNRRLFVLKELCKRAIKEGEIAKNPAVDMSYLSEKNHCRANFLTPNELDTLLKCAKESYCKHLEVAILLGAEHGASLQEILALKWSDINFDFENTGSISFFRTKNSRRRTMRLMPRTREALVNWYKKLTSMRSEAGLKTPLHGSAVCCHLDGRHVTTIKHPWTKARKQAGLDDFHFHDLRHTFCSSIIMAGGDIKTASDMIGHSSIKMTNRYTHLTQLAYDNMQDKLASYYDKKTQYA